MNIKSCEDCLNKHFCGRMSYRFPNNKKYNTENCIGFIYENKGDDK